MIKNQKGISMMVLIVTIVVILIVFSIATKNAYTAARQAKFYSAISQMKAMQTKVNSLYEEYINADDAKKQEIEKYGQDLTESEKLEDAQVAYEHVNKNNITGDNTGILEDYRYYSTDYIKNTLDEEGILYDFIVNIKTRMVILLEGVSKTGNKRTKVLCFV